MENKLITPIGYVKSPFKDKFGIPRQSGRVPSLTGEINFYKPYSTPEAFRRLEQFSHVWVIFGFNKANNEKWKATVRPPRLGGNERVGVFATRSPFRPNGLGLSVVKINEIKQGENGISLCVSGLDLLDGTPVYDIKPYLSTADCISDAISGFAEQENEHKVKVNFLDGVEKVLPSSDLETITACLMDDPRPSYQESGESYAMAYKDYDVIFDYVEGEILVKNITKK